VLAASLVPLPVKDLFSKAGLAWLERVELDPQDRALIQSDQRLMGTLEVELAVIDSELAKHAYGDQRVKLLMTLPGVDFPVAQAVLAALGDISRFKDADHVAAYLGLVPSVRQSAEHCYYGPITRHGNGKARWMLIQAAQHVALHPGPLGVFFRRLRRKKNHNVTVVACARKLAVIAYHMLKNNEPYRYAQPRPTQYKLARLRVRATGKKRKTGSKKGQPRQANWGTGKATRTFPSLPQLYAQEGLPQATAPQELKPGEQRILAAQRVQAFVQSVQQPATLPRKAVQT
jgi:hypothetical protein